MKFKYLSLSAAVILCLFSCQKDDVPEENGQVIPASYLQLVDAYGAGESYIGTTALSSLSKVFFLGRSITVPADEMEIDDCTAGKEPESAVFDASAGFWKVGATMTSIHYSTGTPSESFPVYAWFDEKELSILSSNGDTLTFINVYWKEDGDEKVPEETEEPGGYLMPRIYIWTDGGVPVTDKENYITGRIRVEDSLCVYSDEKVFESTMKIRGRGNTTWGMPKKPYKIKFDEKQSILGIHKDKEWVLLANYDDKTLLRNITAMEISRRLGFSWTPEMISVEMWFNGSYQGVYVFTEHKKVSSHRVNIEPATPEDNEGESLTGGYYLEFENESMSEPCWFKTDRYEVTLMFHEPENPTSEQQEWFKSYLNSFESTLYALGHDDRGPTDWQDYIDADSFINYYILEELVKNPDANFRKSTFLTKERGKKMEIYHVWDFDISLGNCNYWGNGLLPEDFVLKGCVWYNRLFEKDREWVEAVKKRWNEKYDDLMGVLDYIDDQAELLEGARDRNFEKWPILGQYVWPNAVWYDTYEEELEYLKDFYLQRMIWMNDALNNL